jgi:hypothetical protein
MSRCLATASLLVRELLASGGLVAKRTWGRRGEQTLTRTIEVSSCITSVHVGIDQPRGCEPMIETRPWIEARGIADEALGGERDCLVSVHIDDDLKPGPLRPAAVGAVIQTRPEVTAVLGLPHADFDRLWAMALSESLRFVWFSCATPRYRKARIFSASFSSQREE